MMMTPHSTISEGEKDGSLGALSYDSKKDHEDLRIEAAEIPDGGWRAWSTLIGV